MASPKPIDELTSHDLTSHPIWVWATDSEDECDETCVRPYDGAQVPREGICIVACEVIAATGQKFIGYVEVINGLLTDDPPVIIGPAGQYWLDAPPPRRHRAAYESFLGAPLDQLLPASWKLAVHVAGENEYRGNMYRAS